MVQRLVESRTLMTTLLALYALLGIGYVSIRQRKRAWVILSQVHRTTRSAALRRWVEPFLVRNVSLAWDPSGPPNRRFLERLLGGRMVVLKPHVSENEKGVVLVKFSESIREVARGVDVRRLLQDYHLVLEPSWSGYCDRDLLYYSQFDAPVFVMAPESDDYRFIDSLHSNLIPLRMGPSDWVNPDLCAEFLGSPKRYDIILNSNWKPLKRHFALFAALRRIQPRLQVALVGGSMDGRTANDIRRLAEAYGVMDQVTFFEDIPYREVMRINSESRMAILLSLKEGSNRAIPESLLCDIPAIVLEEHVGGVRKNIVPETGRLVPERELPTAIVSMLNELDTFTPRAWALCNISCFATSKTLNEAVRAEALRRGEEWTTDVAVKSNSPEIRLVDEACRVLLSEHHPRLAAYFR